MAKLEVAAPGRSYEVVSDANRPWILPEPWKTPGRPEVEHNIVSAFPTTPWTGYARPQAPQSPQLLISPKAKVM
jgi:hypothetical protein